MRQSDVKPVWGMHAGATGDADRLFLQDNCVAIGWHELGDLSSLANDREAFKALYFRAYPDTKAGAVPVSAGQLYRFLHEVKVGDIVAYPSKADRQIHIGLIDGAYSYGPGLSSTYPHQRTVDWKAHVPRTSFSQGALYEIGSAMSLFSIRNYAEEFRTAMEGKVVPIPDAADPSVGLITESIEENTRDFILKRLSQELKGHPLADFVGHLLGTMGYRSRISLPGPDGGIDIIAHKDELGFEPPIIKVQVKSGSGTVGQSEVSALVGTLSANECAMVVTLATFSPQAKTFARGKANLRLIDGGDMVDLILNHYEQFDSRYKGLLPLKRVYVPEVISNS